MKPTGKQLWKWANKKTKAAENAGEGSVCPTFREAAKCFGCSYDDIEDAINDPPDDVEYLNLADAIGIPGYGYANMDSRGAWLIEAY